MVFRASQQLMKVAIYGEITDLKSSKVLGKPERLASTKTGM